MNLLCLMCLEGRSVAVALSEEPGFVCRSCKAEYGPDAARRKIDVLTAALADWEKALRWLDAYPKGEGPRAEG